MRILSFFLLIILTQSIFPQEIPSDVKSFFDALISGKENLDKYVSPDELNKSRRLQISYEGVQNKYLLGYDLDDELKRLIKEKGYTYSLIPEKLKGDFLKVNFKAKDDSFNKSFYFRNGKLISHASYFAAEYKNFTSEYFNFYISRSDQFNSYSVSQLDKYVNSMADLLKISGPDRELLKREKIIYILCRDTEEIQKVTGFNTRGIYILGFDEIITTYNCHFHELVHLLINFRLKNIPPFTLPFFQEGFATALGGRGGQGRNMLLDAGAFLHSSGFIPANSILTKEAFLSEDATTAYPVSGIYSYYLLKSYGIESYLILYRKYSGDAETVASLKPSMIELPDLEEFNKFIKEYKPQGGVKIHSMDSAFHTIFEIDQNSIKRSDTEYSFEISDNVLISEKNPLADYKSTKFQELFPGREYRGEKYAVVPQRHDISVYNLYTNILIASYYAGLTPENEPVPGKDPSFKFFIDKEVFENEIEEMIIALD